MLGQTNYNLFTNNCEHLATYCKTGKKGSGQVDNSYITGSVVVGGIVGGLAVPVTLPFAVGVAAAAAVSVGVGGLSLAAYGIWKSLCD